MNDRPVILRLWWQCTLCRWKVDTFGVGHERREDRLRMGLEVIDHLEERHGVLVPGAWDAAALFSPAGAVKPRKRYVLVALR